MGNKSIKPIINDKNNIELNIRCCNFCNKKYIKYDKSDICKSCKKKFINKLHNLY